MGLFCMGSAAGSAETVYSNIDQKSGWVGCGSCANPGGVGYNAPHSDTQGVSSPSMDGSSIRFDLGGNVPYSNALWTNHQPGINGATNFVEDFYVYVQNPAAMQALEMDIYYGRNGRKNYFLTECDTQGTYAGTWQIHNIANYTWLHTGASCHMNAYSWNHVTLEFRRESNGSTTFVSVSMNGDKHYFNKNVASQASSSFETTAGIQIDGNAHQNHQTVWVDKLNITAW